MPGASFSILRYTELLDVPVKSVKDRKYRCKGDNTADDWARFQDAINDAAAQGTGSSTGGALVVPPGMYLLSKPLLWPSSGATPGKVFHLTGDNDRSATLVGAKSKAGVTDFPAGRGILENSHVPGSGNCHQIWGGKIRNLSFVLPDVDKTSALKTSPWLYGTARGGTSITITLPVDFTTTTNNFVGSRVELISDPNNSLVAGQSATVSAYNGSTKVATIQGSWAVSPTATTVFAIQMNLQDPNLVYGNIVNNWMQLDVEKVLVEGSNQYHEVLFDLGVGVRASHWQDVFGDPARLTVNYMTTMIRTPYQWKGQDAGVGEDSVGFGLGTLKNTLGMTRRGGWHRTFEGRLYDAAWDTCFDNGVRSGFGGYGIWLKNSFDVSLFNIQNEGNGGGTLRMTGCQHIYLDNIQAPVGAPTEPAWLANHAYSLNDLIVEPKLSTALLPATRYLWKCTQAGTSGSGEPDWTSAPVVDNTVRWTAEPIEAVTDSILVENSRAVRGRGRGVFAGNPANAGRLTVAIRIDSLCRDVVWEDFDVCCGSGLFAAEIAIAAPDSARNVVRGRQIQAFSDLRELYQVGTLPFYGPVKIQTRLAIGTLTDLSALTSKLHVGNDAADPVFNTLAHGSGAAQDSLSEASGEVARGLYVHDGARNRRVKMFLNDAYNSNAGVFGLIGTKDTAGNIPFIINFGGTDYLWIDANQNLGVAGQASFGTGALKVLGLPDTVDPSGNPSAGAVLYSKSGELFYRGAGGVRTLAALSIAPGGYKALNWHATDSLVSNLAAVQDQLTLTGLDFSAAGTITDVGVTVVGTAGGSSVRLGIYADSNCYPGSLLVEVGSIDSASSGGFKSLTLASPLAIIPGRYWLGAVAQGGAPTLATNTGGYKGMSASSGSIASSQLTGWQATGVTGALPGTYSANSGWSNAIRVVAKVS